MKQKKIKLITFLLLGLTGIQAQTVKDIDGNVYKTITIGTQTWMAENLKVTKFSDGIAIPLVTDETARKNLTSPSYCWYNNDQITYAKTYGALYNWYTVNTAKLCPIGWHVPTDAEWTTLIIYSGGAIVAGSKLKEIGTTHWTSPNTAATNEIKFTALPGGTRYGNGTFHLIGSVGYWWSATKFTSNFALYHCMGYDVSYVTRSNCNKRVGFSVRCLMD
jgi:uncharacterized protein (TIGR02145 family)